MGAKGVGRVEIAHRFPVVAQVVMRLAQCEMDPKALARRQLGRDKAPFMSAITLSSAPANFLLSARPVQAAPMSGASSAPRK